MRISHKEVTKYTITDLDGLDPVHFILEDIQSEGRSNQGKFTVECYGKSWTVFFGSMGDCTIKHFIENAEIGYLVGKLSDMEYGLTDYETISEDLKTSVEENTLLFYVKELTEYYGADWYRLLPSVPNPKYKYLCRILKAVQEALKSLGDMHYG